MLSLRHVGAAIRCYVCNSRYNDRCDYIPEDGKDREDLVADCDELPEAVGRQGRNYTLCRKFIQDGKIKV